MDPLRASRPWYLGSGAVDCIEPVFCAPPTFAVHHRQGTSSWRQRLVALPGKFKMACELDHAGIKAVSKSVCRENRACQHSIPGGHAWPARHNLRFRHWGRGCVKAPIAPGASRSLRFEISNLKPSEACGSRRGAPKTHCRVGAGAAKQVVVGGKDRAGNLSRMGSESGDLTEQAQVP
jgi:hypothetical protein